MSDVSINHVSDTAFLVAWYRAEESSRRDALFHDPLAARLAGEKGRVLAAVFATAAVTRWTVAIRTVIIDDFIRAAISSGVDTIVNLGAGLDTRPYRLDLPAGLRWIEVDYADVIAYKTSVLASETPRCRLERMGVDLADDAARRELLEKLEANGGRLIVLTEGVVPYLDEGEAGALADDLRKLPRLDSWIIDYFSPVVHDYRKRAGLNQQLKQAPLKFKPADWFAFFAAHGWRPRTVRYLAFEGAQRGRRIPLPWKMRLVIKLTRLFAPAEKRAQLGRAYGYVLLEPAPRTQPLPSHSEVS